MSDCEVGYLSGESTKEKIEAVEAFAKKWNAIRSEMQYDDVTLVDRNYSEGLIVTQTETEDHREIAINRQYPRTLITYTVTNASKECWSESRKIAVL